MRQYLTARAEEDEQGNVHVDESEDVMKEEEEDFSTTTTATRISSKVDYQFFIIIA